MSDCLRSAARKALFTKNYTDVNAREHLEKDEKADFTFLATDESEKDKLVDVGDSDILIETIKNEYLKFRYGIEWPLLTFEVRREEGVPVEFFCCNDPNITEKASGSIPFDYENTTGVGFTAALGDYFSHQQKGSIRGMIRLELNNAIIVKSVFFDPRVLNVFALGSRIGFLCNDVGSGKTRIIVAMAFLDIYSQKSGGFVGRNLPISFYRELVESSDSNTVDFKQFFGATEFRDNVISNMNANKLGNDLERAYRYKCLDATLMVVSASTFHQWKQEVLDMEARFGWNGAVSNPDTPNPEFLFINASEDFSTPDPFDDPDYFGKTHRVKEHLDAIDKNGYKIIVMTNKWFNDNMVDSNRYWSFNRICFDEPDTIEYKSKHKIIGRFTWLISTTVREWIDKRYTLIKGTTELAGKDNATRVGEVELCTYDDPSIVDIVLDVFSVRDDSSPVDNSRFLNFIKYPPFADNFYKKFDIILKPYSALREALSAYDVESLDFVLGKDSSCVMDKVYKYISGKYSDKSEITALKLRFDEQTEFATVTEDEKYNLKSENYKSLKIEYYETKKEMQRSSDEKDVILGKFDSIIKQQLTGSSCTICGDSFGDLSTGFVYDCCFGVVHSECHAAGAAGAAGAVGTVTTAPVRRRRKVDASEPVASLPQQSESANFGSAALFSGILHASGKKIERDGKGKITIDTIERGNQVSTDGLFDINRFVKAEEYKNVEDVYSAPAIEKRDCKHCGISGSLVFPLKGSLVLRAVEHLSATTSTTRGVNGVTRQGKVKEMLLNRTPEQRFLIYATNGSNITKMLGDTIPFRIVEGSAQERERAIVEYRRGEVPILVLLRHENAAGLNLTETTDLIIFNQTSDTITEQVIGRVDRLGLNHDVNIHLFDTNENMNVVVFKKYGK